MDALSAAGAQLFDGSFEAGILVKPDLAAPPVEFFSDSGSFDINRRSAVTRLYNVAIVEMVKPGRRVIAEGTENGILDCMATGDRP